EKATSAEVNGLPSCQMTPSRSLKVTERPSSEPSQLVASRGANPFSPSNEASASGSTTLLAMKKTPLEATTAGLRFFGSESAATTRRPPPCANAFQGRAAAAAMKAALCMSARRVSENWDIGALHGKRRRTRRHARRDHEFQTADSLARGMYFCTGPGPGKFLSAIRTGAQRQGAQGMTEGIRGIEAGAQWEMLPEGRRPDGPSKVRRSMTKAQRTRFVYSVIAE